MTEFIAGMLTGTLLVGTAVGALITRIMRNVGWDSEWEIEDE